MTTIRQKLKPIIFSSRLNKEFAQKYTLCDSPFKGQITKMLKNIYFNAQTLDDPDDCMAMNNALYCAASSRMCKRKYESDNKAYLSDLINDVNEGKRHFLEVCYDNDYARDVFTQLNLGLMLLYSDIADK